MKRITTFRIEQKTTTHLRGPDFLIFHLKGTTNIVIGRRSVKSIPIRR
jgi:hypothetical protein